MISLDVFGNALFSAASFFCLISIVVFIHELGHYFVARMCGVHVESFSIGFGKEVFGFTSANGTRWKFCVVLLGGYVKMFGEGNKPENISSGDMPSNAFYARPRYQRALIVFAGPALNLVSAFFMLFLLFSIFGSYGLKPEVGGVYANSPADKAGIIEGDVISEIDGKKVISFADIVNNVQDLQGRKDVSIVISRGSEVKNFNLDLSVKSNNPSGNYLLGVISSGVRIRLRMGIFESANKAIDGIISVVGLTVSSVGKIIFGHGLNEIGGPIRIAKYSAESVKGGVEHIIWFLAVISVNLGVMNLLPIPMLDGGYLFQYLIEVVFLRGKPAGATYQKVATVCGVILIVILMLCATFNDIKYLVVGD